MFLAWNEMKYSKTRFALIIGVVILVSFLVYILTGLAYGLSQDNRTGVDKWEADAVVLTEEANATISMSTMPISQRDEVDADEVAVLGQTAGIVHLEGETDDEDQINVSFFGIDTDEFIMPEVIEGEEISDDFEAVADISLQEEEGIAIGDVLILAGTDTEITIVGFTEQAKFNITPILYTTIQTYQEIRYGDEEVVEMADEEQISALILRDENVEGIEIEDEELEIYSISDFILELPGYTAQLVTFALMIGFLIICKGQLYNVGNRQFKIVGFPTFFYILFLSPFQKRRNEDEKRYSRRSAETYDRWYQTKLCSPSETIWL